MLPPPSGFLIFNCTEVVPGDPILPHEYGDDRPRGSLTDEFPGLLTLFSTFLEETGWGNASATYEDLSMMI